MTLLRKHLARKRFVSPPLSSLTDAIQETCVLNCADKFMKHTERVGARFAELNGESLCYLLFVVEDKLMCVAESMNEAAKSSSFS